MTRAARRRLLLVVGSVLVGGGLTALGWCGVSLARSYLYQVRETAVLNREILTRPAQRLTNLRPEEGALLGSISIPRVGIYSVIAEGTDNRTLALGVGHIAGTALPGTSGNVALAGHRDTLFRGLRHLRDGDDILLTTAGGTALYEVASLRVVSPYDVGVLKDTGRPLLTLVTCYPFDYIGPAPKRFIVRAYRVGGD